MSCLSLCDSAKFRRKIERSKEKERVVGALDKNEVPTKQKMRVET